MVLVPVVPPVPTPSLQPATLPPRKSPLSPHPETPQALLSPQRKGEKSRSPRGEQPLLYVSNLPVHFGEATLRDHLQHAGPALTLDLPQKNGSLAGFAFVRYRTPEATVEALSWGGTWYGGNKINVYHAKSIDGKRNRIG